MNSKSEPEEKSAEVIRAILLGDAHPLFRSGMRHMLQAAFNRVEIVEVGNPRSVLDCLKVRSFDLVLTSLFSDEGDLDEFVLDLLQRSPAGRIVILSSVDDPNQIRRILATGAAGFVPKETPPDIILNAIRLVLAGGTYIPPAALRAVSNGSTHEVSSSSKTPAFELAAEVPLTERQREVLNLVVQGAGNKAIARSLGLSAGTVKGHVASLLRLYGVENRTELASAVAKRGGLIFHQSQNSGLGTMS